MASKPTSYETSIPSPLRTIQTSETLEGAMTDAQYCQSPTEGNTRLSSSSDETRVEGYFSVPPSSPTADTTSGPHTTPSSSTSSRFSGRTRTAPSTADSADTSESANNRHRDHHHENKKFMDDIPTGKGMGPDADIWHVYNDEAEARDKELLETYNGGMDNMLLFAALFSAVVTAFLCISLPLLQANTWEDPSGPEAATSAQLSTLIEILLVQQAGAQLPTVPIASPYQPAPFTISSSAFWINALWAISLVISVTTAILGMLVKQWLRAFMTDLPSPCRDKAHARQFRFQGLNKWNVPLIAESLPVCIHAAVEFFFVGLVTYSWTLSAALGGIVCGLVSAATILYVSMSLAPLLWLDCPYKSPLTNGIDLAWTGFNRALAYLITIRPVQPMTRTKYTLLLWRTRAHDRTLFQLCEDEQELNKGAILWLNRSSSDMRITKAVVAAAYSFEKSTGAHIKALQDLESEKNSALHVRHLHLLQSPVLLHPKPPSSWDKMKEVLEEVAIARSFSFWTSGKRRGGLRTFRSWVNDFPQAEIPEDDRILYYAYLLHCAGAQNRRHNRDPTKQGGGGLKKFANEWIEAASDAFIKGLECKDSLISTFGCGLFLEYVRRLVEHVPKSVLDKLLASIPNYLKSANDSVPVELLRLIILIWGTDSEKELYYRPSAADSNLWITASITSTNSDENFLIPLIKAKERSAVGRALIIYAVNGMKSRRHGSLSSREAVKAIVQWFQDKEYIYPTSKSTLLTPEHISRECDVEMKLIRSHLQRSDCGHHVFETEMISICQLVDIELEESCPVRPEHKLQDHCLDKAKTFFSALPKFIEFAKQHGGHHAVVVSTHMMRFAAYALDPCGPKLDTVVWLPAFKDWLSMLNEFGFEKVIIESPQRCKVLLDVLSSYTNRFDAEHPAFDTFKASGLPDLLRRHSSHQHFKGSIKLRMLLAICDAAHTKGTRTDTPQRFTGWLSFLSIFDVRQEPATGGNENLPMREQECPAQSTDMPPRRSFRSAADEIMLKARHARNATMTTTSSLSTKVSPEESGEPPGGEVEKVNLGGPGAENMV